MKSAGHDEDRVRPSLKRIPSTRWVVLAVALAIQTATSVVAAAFPVLLPFVKAEFHLTFAQAGFLSNFPFVGGFLTIAVAGWAVDALGDRLVLVLGGVVTGLAGILCAIAPTFMVLLVALLVMGAGISTSAPAGSVAVRTAFPLRLRGMVMSIRQTGVPIGGLFAALVLPWIAIGAGWRAAVAAAGGASIAIALVGLAMYGSGSRVVLSDRDGGSLLHVLTRDMTITATSGVFLVASQMCLLTYLVVYLINDRRLAVTAAAFFLAMAQLAGAAGRIFWGVVSDRLLGGGRRNALLLAGGTGAVGSLAMAIMPGTAPFPLLVVAILVCAAGAVGWNGVQNTFFSELAKPGSEGRSVGLGQMIQQPGVLIGPFLFGLVVDLTSSFRLAWLLVALLLGVAILIMFAARDASHLNATTTAEDVGIA